MIEMLLFAGISLGLLLLLAWAGLLKMAPRRSAEEDAGLPIEALLPISLEKYSRMQGMIRDSDEMCRRSGVPKEELRAMAAARRRLAQELLADLKRDFSRLDRLMCAIAAVSPNPSRKKEVERAWLWVRFRLHYSLAWLNLTAGRLSQPDLTSICKLFDRLAARTQAALDTVEQNSLTPLRSRLRT